MEERFIGFHGIGNSTEQPFGNAGSSTKHVSREGTTRQKVVTHDLLVAFDSVPMKYCTTNLQSRMLPLRSGYRYPVSNHYENLVFFGVYDFTLGLGV